MYVRYVGSYPALPAERRIRTHHTSQQYGTRHGIATPLARKANDMNVTMGSATRIGATRTVTIDRPRQAPLRITKRGRAVVTVLAAIPLVAGALVFAVNGGMATATAHRPAVPRPSRLRPSTLRHSTLRHSNT